MSTKNRHAVTVCILSDWGMGVHAIDAYLVEHGRKPYAQYDAAPFVVFTPKGKRNPRGWQGGYKPYCVIVDGHHAAELQQSRFEVVEESQDLRVERGRFSGFSPGWATDFDGILDAFLKRGGKLVADYRHNQNETTKGAA